MEFPVRCFTCGKVIGNLYAKYIDKVSAKEAPSAVLDELGIKRYCCRRMFISHIDLASEAVMFKK